MSKLTFIDLFAGIGGFHLALHNVGAECVFASEWDESARLTYETNFAKISPKIFTNGNFVGDIKAVDKKSIPDSAKRGRLNRSLISTKAYPKQLTHP